MASSSPKDWSLFEHVAFVLGRWYLLGLGAVVCGAVGYGAAALLPARVGATGLLRIGTAYSVGLLAKPGDVAVRISSPAFLGTLVASHPKEFPDGTHGVQLSATAPESSDLVAITATAPTAAQAADAVRLASRRIATAHARISDRVRKLTNAQLASMDRGLAALETEVKGVSPAKRGADATAEAFLDARREALVPELYRLRRRRDQYQLHADPSLNPPTALVDGPTVHRERSRRKAALLGAACGLVLGAFLAYFLAFGRRRPPAARAGEPAVAPVPDERAAGAP